MEIFFGDLRLAPRSKKTYRHGIEKFLRHLEQHEGIDTAESPVTILTADHVTSFASLIVPTDISTPEEVSQMRTAQNNLSALRKFCAYLTAYDLHPDSRHRSFAGSHLRDDAPFHPASSRCQD